MMYTIHTLRDALGPLLGLLLLSALILELYNLVYDLLPSGQPAHRSEFTGGSICSVHQWPKRIATLKNMVMEVFRDFALGRYYIPWNRKSPVIIRSPEHMQELSEAPELSQRAVYADIFGFKYAMHYGDVSLDPNEQAAHRYRLFSRAIKITGLAQIAALQPYLQARLEKTLHETIGSHPTSELGWKSVKIAPVMRDLASGMLSVYFFGENLSQEKDFAVALLRFYQDVIAFMGALQIVPSCMASVIYSLITKRGKALDVIFRRLNNAMDLSQKGWYEREDLRSMTLLQNMIQASKDSDYWTPNTLIQAIVGIWFAASHQPWINLHFILLELCSRPEFVESIRQEIERQEKLDYATISTLPILDSFIKESVRLNPLDLMSIRRKALKPFQFTNGGPIMETGQIACVPAYEIMHNEVKYPHPNEFDGLRFMKDPSAVSGGNNTTGDGGGMRGTTFTEGSRDFPIWGFGSKICPGRWHGALVVKMAIIHLIREYDFRLEDENARRFFFWETFQMPYESTRVLFRKRAK